ncbi:MAG: hypothetical protein KAG19_04525, partial [Methylococcales bacterium]|nr:hypothetical protein [Methylococcales bacterium]
PHPVTLEEAQQIIDAAWNCASEFQKNEKIFTARISGLEEKLKTNSTNSSKSPSSDLFSSIRLKPSPFRRTDLSQMLYSRNGLSLWQSYSLQHRISFCLGNKI